MSRKKPRGVWALAVGGAVVVTAIVVWAAYPERPERAGMRMIDCALRGDGGGLLRYANPGEQGDLNLTEVMLNRFLERVFLPRLAGFKREGEPVVERYRYLRSVKVGQALRHPDGRVVGLSFVVVPTEEGNQAPSIVADLAMTAVVSTALPPGKPYPRGAARRRFWAEAFRSSLADLDSSGLEGLVLGDEPPVRLTWRQFIDRQERLAAELDRASQQ
jgi:hypothetical protein